MKDANERNKTTKKYSMIIQKKVINISKELNWKSCQLNEKKIIQVSIAQKSKAKQL